MSYALNLKAHDIAYSTILNSNSSSVCALHARQKLSLDTVQIFFVL